MNNSLEPSIALQNRIHMMAIAGGAGTRFWPLSRKATPKQLLDLNGEGTLLEQTFARLADVAPPERWWMVVGASQREGCHAAASKVPAAHVIEEPCPRNTAAAIALGALHLQHHDPDALMVVLPADHHVADKAAFAQGILRAAALAQEGPIVTLGITPTAPATGYGYIQGGAADGRMEGAVHVARFCEKPNRTQAEAFLSQGGFWWNAGIFVMKPSTLFAEIERQLPKLAKGIKELKDALNQGDAAYAKALASIFPTLPSISIDYGVMEGAQAVSVIPLQCGWDDVGSWSALGALSPADEADNVRLGHTVLIDCKGCIAYAQDNHTVAVVGGQDLVVVHTPDATLVLPKERAQDVRQIVDALRAEGCDARL